MSDDRTPIAKARALLEGDATLNPQVVIIGLLKHIDECVLLREPDTQAQLKKNFPNSWMNFNTGSGPPNLCAGVINMILDPSLPPGACEFRHEGRVYPIFPTEGENDGK